MCVWQKRMELYRESWNSVRDEYCKGYCVSERGLQAILYGELRRRLHSCQIVVEPTWWKTVDGKRSPDLVIVQDGYITDIFELKFVPQYWATWVADIDKLRRYLNHNGPGAFPVKLCPSQGTGEHLESAPLHETCRLHFVVVCQHDGQAVADPIPGLNEQPPVNRWRGPIEAPLQDWNIEFNVAE